MREPDQDSLIKLNSVLDKMLQSEAFRQQMAESDADLLRVASLLIDAPHPQITKTARQSIRQEMMRALVEVETQPFQHEISPYEKQTEDLSRSQIVQDIARATDDPNQDVASLLASSSPPTLSNDKRDRIFDKLLQRAPTLSPIPDDPAPEPAKPNLSEDAKSRIYVRMLEAQRQLQLDALTQSDEALAIASDNPDPLIQTAVMLRQAPVPMLSPQGRVHVRERILPPLKVQPMPEPVAPAQPARRVLQVNFGATIQRLVASVVIVMFISLLVAPSASADSLPGDLLYPVKRGLEQVSLQLTASDRGRAHQHLDHAQERIVEIDTLYARGTYNTHLLDDALTSVENATRIAREAQFLDVDIRFQDDVATVLNALDIVIVRYDEAPVAIETLDNLQARQQEVNAVLALTQVTPLPEEPVPTSTALPTSTEAPIEPTNTPEITEPAPELAEVTEEPALLTDAIILYTNANGSVRVRTAPDLSAEILTTIAHGAEVTQIGTNADQTWVQVRLSDGREGWIASFLLVEQPPTIPETAGNNNASGNANSNAGNNNNASGNANGNAGNNANGNANGNAGNNANGNANGNADNNANSNAGNNNNASGNANGNAGNNANGNANGNAGNNNNASGNANGNAGNNP